MILSIPFERSWITGYRTVPKHQWSTIIIYWAYGLFFVKVVQFSPKHADCILGSSGHTAVVLVMLGIVQAVHFAGCSQEGLLLWNPSKQLVIMLVAYFNVWNMTISIIYCIWWRSEAVIFGLFFFSPSPSYSLCYGAVYACIQFLAIFF